MNTKFYWITKDKLKANSKLWKTQKTLLSIFKTANNFLLTCIFKYNYVDKFEQYNDIQTYLKLAYIKPSEN